jgi:SAM-dependent methyltransferase
MTSDLINTIKGAFVSQLEKTYLNRDDDSKEIFLSRVVEKYEPNGKTMISEINSSSPSLVIDLGCGVNQYKTLINNLVGVDIIGCREDIVADISDLSMHFKDGAADVVLALGSINFGNDEVIEKQLKEVKRLLKPGGVAYFRANQNDHDPNHEGKLYYYEWSRDRVIEWAEKLKFEIISDIVIKEGRQGVLDRMNKEFVGKQRSKTRLFWKWRSV